MAVNRSLWKRAMTKNYAPPWPCPSCRDGVLQLERGSFHHAETARSRRNHHEEDFHFSDVEFSFSALLKCVRCGDIVSCCGTGGLEENHYHDTEGDLNSALDPIFFVKLFSRPLPIIRAPQKCPAEVKGCLDRSFLVAFCDFGAAANHIRQSVEEFLSTQGIDRLSSAGKFVSLETRIRRFAESDPANAERVSALRWFGNFGSHPENLKRDHLFDAYDVLEVLFENVYIGHQHSVRDLVERINRDKRPG